MWKKENNQLYKKFTFTDFKKAWNFMQKVGVLAEEHNHHPTWTNTYNVVEIYLSTHDDGNKIAEKDYVMAKNIDACI